METMHRAGVKLATSGKPVQTVLGPVAAEALGVTLMHEHLLLDARPSWQEPSEASRIALAHAPVSPAILHELRHDPFVNLDNCALFDTSLAAEEVRYFFEQGGGTIVDATCRGIGRDPVALQTISRNTGLHIVMGTGFYLQRTHPPFIETATVEELTALIRDDLLVGERGVRAGYIGEVGVSKDFTAQEEKVLRAAARAQAEAGVALSVHLPGWERHGHRVLDVVEAEGGDLSRTILCHMNPSWHDVSYQTSLADRGAYLEYDMIGMDYYFADQDAQCPSDEENARAVANLISLGYAHLLLLSHDVFLKMMLRHYGGNGYSHISRHFIPRLHRHNVEDETIHMIMVQNPSRVLGGEA